MLFIFRELQNIDWLKNRLGKTATIKNNEYLNIDKKNNLKTNQIYQKRETGRNKRER
jgi:hypothetical protein